MKFLKIAILPSVFALLAIFLWKGFLYTDQPDLEQFTAPKDVGLCSYMNCWNPSQATYPVKVTERTESKINRLTIYIGNRPFLFCSKHARYAASGRWPQQGLKWFLGFGLWLFLTGFISLGVTGLVLYAAIKRRKNAPLPKVKPAPSGSFFRTMEKDQGSVTILKKEEDARKRRPLQG